MSELRELESRHADFASRGVRIVVVSNDDSSAAQSNQRDFPHLIVVSDAEQAMTRSWGMIHSGAGKTGDDTNAPTTLLIDGQGVVRWFKRGSNIMGRPRPDDLLEAIDQRAS